MTVATAGISYVVVPGNIKKISDNFASALGAIEKPYTINDMTNALNYTSAIVKGDETVDPPASLVLPEDAGALSRSRLR